MASCPRMTLISDKKALACDKLNGEFLLLYKQTYMLQYIFYALYKVSHKLMVGYEIKDKIAIYNNTA